MSEPHERLGQAMNARRLDLRKQWKDIATGAKISTAALGAIRRGEYKPSALTARGIEDALDWEHGSVDAILAGGEPTPVGLGAALSAEGHWPTEDELSQMSQEELLVALHRAQENTKSIMNRLLRIVGADAAEGDDSQPNNP